MTSTTPPQTARRATRSELTAPGSFGPAPHAVMTRADLSPAAKLVYFALLDHLGRVGTLVYPGEERLARMTSLTTRSVRRGIRQLEDANLIATHPHAGRTPAHSFTPPDPGQDDANPGQIVRPPGQIVRQTNIPKQQEEALSSQASSFTAHTAVDVALDLEDALALDKAHRTDAEDAANFQALVTIAEDLAAGRLGQPVHAKATLSTVAHQIAHRSPPPRSPLGMFLNEVGKMRLRSLRACSQVRIQIPSCPTQGIER